MDLISSLHRKLQDVTEECDAVDEEYQHYINQIKLIDDEQKLASLRILENEENIRDLQTEIVEKKKCLLEVEKSIRLSNQEIECLESSLDQLPRTMIKIFTDFAYFSAKKEKIINSICNCAVKNQFWDDMISQVSVNVESSREAYRNRIKQLSICKEARGRALEKVLLREEQRFSDLKSRIDFNETRIEQMRSQNSHPPPPIPIPIASGGLDLRQGYELVSTHTVIEEVVEFRGPMSYRDTSNLRFTGDQSGGGRPSGDNSSFGAPPISSDVPSFNRPPQQQQREVPWFLQHKRRRLQQAPPPSTPSSYHHVQSTSGATFNHAAAELNYYMDGSALYDHEET